MGGEWGVSGGEWGGWGEVEGLKKLIEEMRLNKLPALLPKAG